MARGRMLNGSIAGDIELNELSLEAHLAYMMAIPHLDRDGIMEGHPRVVAGRICPLRPEVGLKMVDIIQEWVNAHLVIAYQDGNKPLLYFTGFQKNQNLGATYTREGKSVFPPPPGYTRTPNGLTHDELMTNSCVSCDELLITHARVEVKEKLSIREVNTSLPAAQDTTPTLQQEYFLAICEAVGWDYKTLSEKDKSQVAQAVNILKKANYAAADIRRFMTDVWFNDWRWEKHQQRPTLSQLRQEIGKLHALTPEPVPKKPSLTAEERDRIKANAREARISIKTAEKFNGTIEPMWLAAIEKEKAVGV